MPRTRTNIEIDDDDVRHAMERFEVTTKTEAVSRALKVVRSMSGTREEALAMYGSDPDFQVPADVPPRGAV